MCCSFGKTSLYKEEEEEEEEESKQQQRQQRRQQRNESRNDAHNRGHHPRKSARRASTLVRWGFFAGKRAREREREKAFSIRYMSLIPTSKRVSITNNEGKKRLRH
jgi:hypothetical protein